MNWWLKPKATEVKTRKCKECLEEWIVDPEFITFHVCKGPLSKQDFIVGEIVEEQKEIESI